jgi:ABC-2 type transport system permease protein
MKTLGQIYRLAVRECKIFLRNPIYVFCMLIFPVMVVYFFTSMLGEGLPHEMPVGVVDLDNTSMTRTLIRKLDGMQSSEVVAFYATPTEARRAIQENKIYGFFYIPKGTTQKLLAFRQPKISFYYSQTTLTAGSFVYKDMQTVATLGSAAVGMSTMQARGLTSKQIAALLSPISIDLHQLVNPTSDYNAYLTTFMVPGIIMLFIFLVTTYAIGTELKFDHGRELVEMGGGRIWVSIVGKYLPHTLVWLIIAFGYSFYVFGVLGFPHEGGVGKIVLLNVMMVLSAQGFGIFAFGLMPSLRMSMSISSLWAVLSISMAGAAYPLMGMDGPLQSLAWLFPLRHYFMIYSVGVLNGFPILDVWWHIAALIAFMLLPILVAPKIKNAMLTYVYIP